MAAAPPGFTAIRIAGRRRPRRLPANRRPAGLGHPAAAPGHRRPGPAGPLPLLRRPADRRRADAGPAAGTRRARPARAGPRGQGGSDRRHRRRGRAHPRRLRRAAPPRHARGDDPAVLPDQAAAERPGHRAERPSAADRRVRPRRARLPDHRDRGRRRGKRGRDRPAPADRGAPVRPDRARRPLRHLPDARGRRRRRPGRPRGPDPRQARPHPARRGPGRGRGAPRRRHRERRPGLVHLLRRAGRGGGGRPDAARPASAGGRTTGLVAALRVRADPAARGPGRAPVPHPRPPGARRPAAHRPRRRARPHHRARRPGQDHRPAAGRAHPGCLPGQPALGPVRRPRAGQAGLEPRPAVRVAGRGRTAHRAGPDHPAAGGAHRGAGARAGACAVPRRPGQPADAADVPPAGRRADAPGHRPAARSAARAERLHAERDPGPPPRHRVPVRAHPADHQVAGP